MHAQPLRLPLIHRHHRMLRSSAACAVHHFPCTAFVPGGARIRPRQEIDRSIRFGKFFSFALSAATPSISTMRELTTGSNSGAAVTARLCLQQRAHPVDLLRS